VTPRVCTRCGAVKPEVLHYGLDPKGPICQSCAESDIDQMLADLEAEEAAREAESERRERECAG